MPHSLRRKQKGAQSLTSPRGPPLGISVYAKAVARQAGAADEYENDHEDDHVIPPHPVTPSLPYFLPSSLNTER